MAKVHFSAREDRFWIRDGKGGVLWFDSSLEAEDAARQIELRRAADAERDRIVAWLRDWGCSDCGDVGRRIAEQIAAGEHRQ